MATAPEAYKARILHTDKFTQNKVQHIPEPVYHDQVLSNASECVLQSKRLASRIIFSAASEMNVEARVRSEFETYLLQTNSEPSNLVSNSKMRRAASRASPGMLVRCSLGVTSEEGEEEGEAPGQIEAERLLDAEEAEAEAKLQQQRMVQSMVPRCRSFVQPSDGSGAANLLGQLRGLREYGGSNPCGGSNPLQLAGGASASAQSDQGPGSAGGLPGMAGGPPGSAGSSGLGGQPTSAMSAGAAETKQAGLFGPLLERRSLSVAAKASPVLQTLLRRGRLLFDESEAEEDACGGEDDKAVFRSGPSLTADISTRPRNQPQHPNPHRGASTSQLPALPALTRTSTPSASAVGAASAGAGRKAMPSGASGLAGGSPPVAVGGLGRPHGVSLFGRESWESPCDGPTPRSGSFSVLVSPKTPTNTSPRLPANSSYGSYGSYGGYGSSVPGTPRSGNGSAAAALTDATQVSLPQIFPVDPFTGCVGGSVAMAPFAFGSPTREGSVRDFREFREASGSLKCGASGACLPSREPFVRVASSSLGSPMQESSVRESRDFGDGSVKGGGAGLGQGRSGDASYGRNRRVPPQASSGAAPAAVPFASYPPAVAAADPFSRVSEGSHQHKTGLLSKLKLW